MLINIYIHAVKLKYVLVSKSLLDQPQKEHQFDLISKTNFAYQTLQIRSIFYYTYL